MEAVTLDVLDYSGFLIVGFLKKEEVVPNLLRRIIGTDRRWAESDESQAQQGPTKW